VKGKLIWIIIYRQSHSPHASSDIRLRRELLRPAMELAT
jgi:hypothetical protein